MAIQWKPALVLIVGIAIIGAWHLADGAGGTILIESDDSSDEGWSARWSGAPFDRITLAGPDNVDFVAGGDHAVKATGDSKALEKLQFKVSDGELRIRRKSSNWSFGDSGQATIAVSAPALRGLLLAGSGSAKIDRMEGDRIELNIAGSSNADIGYVSAKVVEGSIAGSGSLRLAGRAENAEISVAGSGSVMGEKFSSDKVDISIAGSGDVTLASDGTVDASLMGSGDVTIKGSARCRTSSMGSGTLNCG